MTTLMQIVEEKKKTLKSLEYLSSAVPSKNTIQLTKSLLKSNQVSVIAEIKRQSPSEGSLRTELTVEDVIPIYNQYASAISVLTEEKFFKGSITDLKKVRSITKLPILRKDFIIDPVQIIETRLCGANAFLLITAILSTDQLKELLEVGRQYNMQAIVEVHTTRELETALSLDIDILGINNRNLHDLSIDLSVTNRLLEKIPKTQRDNIVIISESGFSTKEQINSLYNKVDAVLVGSSLMKSNNIETLLSSLVSN